MSINVLQYCSIMQGMYLNVMCACVWDGRRKGIPDINQNLTTLT